MRTSLKQLLSDYGPIALVVYLTIFVIVMFGAWIALRFGWQPHSVLGNVGTLAGAYLITKATQWARIASTIALTPVVARIYRRAVPKPPA